MISCDQMLKINNDFQKLSATKNTHTRSKLFKRIKSKDDRRLSAESKR